MESIEIEARLWRWQSAGAPTAWHFLTIEGEAAGAVHVAAMTGQWLDGRPGFGSAKVMATIGETSWRTSVFPHKSSGGWLLPVKASVRRSEAIAAGDLVRVTVAL